MTQALSRGQDTLHMRVGGQEDRWVTAEINHIPGPVQMGFHLSPGSSMSPAFLWGTEVSWAEWDTQAALLASGRFPARH